MPMILPTRACIPGAFRGFSDYFAAQRVPDWHAHEVDRAKQRMLGSLFVSALWILRYFGVIPGAPLDWYVMAMPSAYLALSLIHRHLLVVRGTQQVFLMYVFLVLDPIILTVLLAKDPETFAFLNPFLIVVVIRSGMRYGVRTLYLSWGMALGASALLSTNAFWLSNVELGLAYLLMLLAVPTFFTSLIRRIHNARAIEEDRARLLAIHDSIVARNAFLAAISHEIRSPLQGLISSLELLDVRNDLGRMNKERDELAARIHRASLQLNIQLRDILTLAKGEAGRLEIHAEPFEAGALVQAMADSAREFASSRGLRLTVELPHDATFVLADGMRIDQILTNLVMNSIRYTDAGQVRVTLHPYSAEKRLLRIDIADTGPGIPRAVLPSLFESDQVAPFNGGRSGIGLAVVRTLVDHLGGKVSVTSTGNGSVFVVEIPAEPLPDEPTMHPSGEMSGRVLVVDDRDDVLDSVTTVVDELGFECDRASSAAAAAHLLARRRYDTVLLDVEMPVKGGAELAAEIRDRTGPNQTARLIGMSASEIGREVRTQFDACLAKPIEFTALRTTLLVGVPTSRPSQPGLWVDEAAVDRTRQGERPSCD